MRRLHQASKGGETKMFKRRKASLLLYVLCMIVFLSAIMVSVFQYASAQLKIKSSASMLGELRADAYNALNVAIAGIEEYKFIDGGLYSIDQGFGNLLSDRNFELPSGNTIEITVEDESGKIPLVNMSEEMLIAFFVTMNFDENTAQTLTDCLLDWTDADSGVRLKGAEDEEYAPGLPNPPNRNLRDYSELRWIKNFDKYFFNEDASPNEFYKIFVENISLEEYQFININSANEFTLKTVYECNKERYDERTLDAIKGIGVNVEDGITWLKSFTDLSNRGVNMPTKACACEIALLRINIKVTRGIAIYHLSAMYGVMPNASNATTTTTRQRGRGAGAGQTSGAQVLRISEYTVNCY